MSDIRTNTGTRKPAALNELLVETGLQLTTQAANPLSGANKGIFTLTADGELYYYDGVHAAFKLTSGGAPAGGVGGPLTDAHIIVGSALNIATDVAMGGEASISNTGSVTLSNSAVIGKALSGYTRGAGTISASSTILQAIQIADGNTFVGLNGYNTTITGSGGGTLTLTNASAYQQYFTGSSTHSVILPVTSTLALGWQYQIVNNSSGAVSVYSSGVNLVTTVAGSSSAVITCILTSGTGAASWSVLVAFPPLTSAHIFVGNVGNQATDVAMSGQATISNTGAVTLDNAAVIAKVLTAYAAAPGTISATDSILQGIQKLDGNINYQMLAGGTGGLLTKLDFTPTGTPSISSATYADITGCSDQTLSTPISGPHLFTLTFFLAQPAGIFAYSDNYFQLLIDGAATEFSQLVELSSNTNIEALQYRYTLQVIVNLAAGSHTIRPQAKVTANNINYAIVNGIMRLTIQAQGAGINGLEVTESALGADADFTANSYSQVGSVQCVVNTLANERVDIRFTGTGYQVAGTYSDIIIGYSIDGAATVPMVHTDSGGASGGKTSISFATQSAALTAGSHTIRLMAQNFQNTGTYRIPYDSLEAQLFQVTRTKSNGLGAGTIVTTSATPIQNTNITSVTYINIGSAITINTIANETVLLTGTIEYDAFTSQDVLFLAYSLDSAAEVELWEGTCVDVQEYRPAAFVRQVTIAAAGSHTIQLRTKVADGHRMRIFDGNSPSGFQVTQYRGGLIPIKNNAVDVVTTPSDLDFTSDFAVTNPSALKAQIDLNCLDLTTALKVQPLADATYQLGDTAKNFFGLYLDHGVTDGGAVYFNAGTTSFLKSNAAGSTLDVGGFTSITTVANAIGGSSLLDTGVTGKTLTGFVSGAGTVSAADTILSAIDKLDGNINYQMLAGGTGGYLNALFYSSSGDTVTNASFEDISGMVDQTISVPISGTYMLTLDGFVASASNDSAMAVAAVVDGGTAQQFGASINIDSAINYNSFTTHLLITLAAGSHTIRPQWKRTSGSGTPTLVNGNAWVLHILAQGAGINGLEVAEYNLASPFTVTQTYANVPGANMAQVDSVQLIVNTLANERVEIKFDGVAQDSGAPDEWIMGYQVDSDTPVVAYYNQTAATYPSINWSVFSMPLAAGSHTIKLMACKGAGDTFVIFDNNNLNPSRFQATRFKSNGLGAGSILTYSNVPTNTSISQAWNTSPGANMAQVGSTQCVITAVGGEKVTVSFNATSGIPGSSGLVYGYQVDSDTPVVCGRAENQGVTAIGFTETTAALTAGSHTIKLMAAKNGTAPSIYGPSGDGTLENRFEVYQYRGGLIPIKNNAVDIVTTPSDLDFTSDFAVTNPSALKAQIDLNCIDLSTALKIQPLADATYQLGDTAKNFFALYLDHAATDGGSVYFNAATTSFLKSTADGLTLDIAGFTAITVAGTVDGVDISAHDHSSSSAQTRLAAKDRRRTSPDKKASADSAATDVTVEHILFQAQDAVTVTKVFYLPDAALTADDTNYATLTVYRRDSSGGTQVVIASISTTSTGGSGNWTAFDGVDLGALTNTAIAAGQVITWEITKTLLGVVVPAGTLQVEYTVD